MVIHDCTSVPKPVQGLRLSPKKRAALAARVLERMIWLGSLPRDQAGTAASAAGSVAAAASVPLVGMVRGAGIGPSCLTVR